MSLPSLPGVLKVLVKSPVFFAVSLLLLIMEQIKVSLTVTKIPPAFRRAMDAAFQNSLYVAQKNNWFAVSKMETAGFASSLYRIYNNPWGMRPSKVRKHTQSGSVSTSNGEFATYDSLDDAAADIVLYMAARKYPTSEMSLHEFVSLMQAKGYFVGESINSYYSKVKAWIER
jgi:hypothetical protein